MGNVFAVLQLLAGIAERILRDGSVELVQATRAVMQRIRKAAWLAIAWPFILLLAAMPGEGRFWPVHYIVLTVTILILLAFLWMATGIGPLTFLAAEAILSPGTPWIGKFVEAARKATNAIRIVLFFELLAGIYFAWVPIANNRALALTQILIVAAIVCVVGIKGWKPIVAVLSMAFLAITLVFFLYARTPNATNPGGTFIHPLVVNFNIDRRVEEKTSELPGAGQSATQAPPEVPKKKGGDVNSADSSAEQPASPAPQPPAPVEPRRWFKPVSGDEGGYIVRISSGRYVAAGKVGFQIFIQLPDGSASEGLYIDESDGGDNLGSFSAYPNAIAENYIHCTGPVYPCRMFSGMPTYLNIEVDRPSGVNTLAFSLKIAPGGGEWIEYDFTNIPVEER